MPSPPGPRRDVYKRQEKDAVIIAYSDGGIPEDERALFRRLISRNAQNMLLRSWRVVFTRQGDAAAAAEEEVRKWNAC